MTDGGIREFKICIIGKTGVGKTYLLSRWINQDKTKEFQTRSTIGVLSMSKNIEFESKSIKVLLLDTAGQEQYDSMATTFARDQDAAIVTFALNDKESFDKVEHYLNFVRDAANPPSTIVIVGNKLDLINDRVVTNEEAKEKAKQLDFQYFEVSAWTNENVDEFFEILISELVYGPQKKDLAQKVDITKEDKNSSCC